MSKIFKYCHSLLKNNFPKSYIFIYILFFILSFVQLFGTISIIPVITILVAPELIVENNYINEIYDLKSYDLKDLKVFFGLSFLFFSFFSQSILFFSTILIKYISSFICLNIRKEFYSKVLKQNMSIYLHYDTAKIGNIFGSEIEKINEYLSSYLTVLKDVLTISIIVFGMVLVEPKIIFGLIIMSFFFIISYFVSKKTLIKNSIESFEIATKFNSIGSMITLGFKEVILLKLKKKIFNDYEFLKKKIISNNLKTTFLIGFPRHLIEVMIYTLIIIYFLNISRSITVQEIPLYGFYFLSIWKCIPSAFSLYKSFALIQGNISSFKSLSSVREKFFKKDSKFLIKKKIKRFKKSIRIDKIDYSYPNSNKNFKFDFEILKQSKVLISGESGSGKTTFMNILCGLLKPSKGEISIDGINIYNDLNGYMNVVGFDTQFNYFINDTVAGNICFKKKLNKRELLNLKKVFKVCGLKNLIGKFENIFKHKLKLNAPEISGGQRQRIALARTLYRNPEILLLDESLNSLDRKSEIEIFDNLVKYYPKLTLIATSHRPIKKLFNRTIKI